MEDLNWRSSWRLDKQNGCRPAGVWKGERESRAGDTVGDYLLPQRLAFQFYYIQRVPDTTRRQQQHETSSGFSPILSCVCVVRAFYSYTRGRRTSRQLCFFFFSFHFLYEGNSVGTTGSFEMIREKEPSSLSLSTGNVFTSLRGVSRGPSVCFLPLRMCVLCILGQGRVKDHRRGRQSVSKEISYSSESPNANKKWNQETERQNAYRARRRRIHLTFSGDRLLHRGHSVRTYRLWHAHTHGNRRDGPFFFVQFNWLLLSLCESLLIFFPSLAKNKTTNKRKETLNESWEASLLLSAIESTTKFLSSVCVYIYQVGKSKDRKLNNKMADDELMPVVGFYVIFKCIPLIHNTDREQRDKERRKNLIWFVKKEFQVGKKK